MSLLKVAGTAASSGTLYVDDVFSTWLYTGNSSTQTITNGIDLAGKGGMVWIKERNFTDSHQLLDTNRGAGYALESNNTFAVNYSPTGLTNFNSTGFSVGSSSYVNSSSYNYASWTFRKAAKFFDVVTYTGTGGGNRQISHSLGTTVGMIIVKRTDTTRDWNIYQRSISPINQNNMQLNTTQSTSDGGQDQWGNGITVIVPTSTQFTVGVSNNASGGTYVAYLYAHDTSSTGIIQCGSYTGNGTTNNISLGWESQYVLIKSASSARPWVVFDTMRGFCNSSSPNSKALFPNDITAETSYYGPTPTATGFGMLSGDGDSDYNASGQTYIYMAIRRPNKPPTTGTQVYNAITRSGTSAAATVTGVGFAPDLVASDARTPSGYGGIFVNKLSGGNNGIRPSAANPEVSGSDLVTQFNNTGYVLGADATSGRLNRSGNTYVNWLFCRAPTFFDVVCYTGTGANTTQAHNLTVAPELMIVKKRDAAGDWQVYNGIVGNGSNYLKLNLTDAQSTNNAIWNGTAPTSSVFSIGINSNVNASGSTYVAYLFATLAGISKVGSYTGNGTGQVIACGFSAGARFVLIKRTDSTGEWYTFDSTRGLTSGSSPYLLLNSTAAEVTGNNGVYASTGGFTLDATAITTTNIATATYIFLAVA